MRCVGTTLRRDRGPVQGPTDSPILSPLECLGIAGLNISWFSSVDCNGEATLAVMKSPDPRGNRLKKSMCPWLPESAYGHVISPIVAGPVVGRKCGLEPVVKSSSSHLMAVKAEWKKEQGSERNPAPVCIPPQ